MMKHKVKAQVHSGEMKNKIIMQEQKDFLSGLLGVFLFIFNIMFMYIFSGMLSITNNTYSSWTLGFNMHKLVIQFDMSA